MKDRMMKKMVTDNNMLAYLHDLLSLRDKNEQFYNLDVYEVLSERALTTVILGLRKTGLIVISFILILATLNTVGPSLNVSLLFGSVAVTSIVYGALFLMAKNEMLQLVYQFKLKKASLYALDSYNYESFVIFLDRFLSEQSTEHYYHAHPFYEIPKQT